MLQASTIKAALGDMVQAGVARGLPPRWFGYQRVVHETVQDYFARHGNQVGGGRYETVHPESVSRHALPCNIKNDDVLPADRGWWGHSFRDIPQRRNQETFIATLPDCLVTWYKRPDKQNSLWPAILNGDQRALKMREIKFRSGHAAVLRKSPEPVRMQQAIWVTERVYDNHSHWLTAHLPKLLLLRERNMLDNVLLPMERTPAMDGSLRLLGLDPEGFKTFDLSRPLKVEQLTVVGTDRFRPELIRQVPDAYGVDDAAPAQRKIFISRAKAERRRLINEDQLWPLLEAEGFERVFMEELSFEEQVELMKSTAVLVAPHGAGLTNMMFCQKGTHIVEIADLGFPNPNFYALAAAMGHNYWLIQADSVGDVHPLEKDLKVDTDAVSQILPRLSLRPNELRDDA
ncbi:glycosyltransferase family 61 protein [Halomonas sp. E19]|uniref:glycosyltransferase family 61 protein n=1 Tax=unclassified Halomonas TaxID=2609666 RepID=UPI004034F01B